MQKPVDFCDEAIERLADGDRLETVARHLRDALTSALRVVAWPQSREVRAWLEQSAASRDAAADMAATVQRPRRLSGIHVAHLYRQAKGRIANEHELAKAHAPKSAEARPPQSLPEACSATLRQLLDADDLAMVLLLP
jgi:hypothetical protein